MAAVSHVVLPDFASLETCSSMVKAAVLGGLVPIFGVVGCKAKTNGTKLRNKMKGFMPNPYRRFHWALGWCDHLLSNLKSICRWRLALIRQFLYRNMYGFSKTPVVFYYSTNIN